MKKLICMLIALLVALNICGCGKKDQVAPEKETTQQIQAETTAPVETTEPEETKISKESEPADAADQEVTVEEVAAGEMEFTPSVVYQGAPALTAAYMNGEAVDGCVVITNVEEAEKKLTDITQEERDRLIAIYEKLASGEMVLPIAEDHVVRELLDVNFKYTACRQIIEHNNKPEALKPEGVYLELTFDLGMEQDAELVVLSYQNEEWVAVEDAVINEDGTVTCKIEDVGPVVFAVLA